jgi:hypothetical protein
LATRPVIGEKSTVSFWENVFIFNLFFLKLKKIILKYLNISLIKKFKY